MISTARPDADFALSAPRVVCKLIADLALNRVHDEQPHDPDENLGPVLLRPHQLDAVERIVASLDTYSGAVLADSVGLGKTFTAMAVAREFHSVTVLAPAGLLPMWRSALQTAQMPNVDVISLHTFSRRARETQTRANPSSRLVIVDEAHHLRTRNTIRYRNVAEFCVNARVLLITATPLHNNSQELRNLLALFLGTRRDALDSKLLASCVIRRNTHDVALPLPNVEEHTAPPIAANIPVLESILTLAPPLPVADGAHASALVRLGLLRAWCSSDAALTSTIRRRQMKGEALLHSLAHGRYPTQRELQSWVVGHDAVQLGFPELLVSAASDECAPLLKTLTAHLDSLQHLLVLHTKTSNSDATRASYLRSLLRADSSSESGDVRTERQRAEAHAPIIAFSQFASTVRALHRALCDIAGVASLTSAGGQIASGAISREQTIHRFSPRSNGRPPPPSHQRIRLLLTTDLLAEGVNLQDSATVVHLDLPWTDALRQQRIGRIARMGSRHETVHSHTIEPPMGSAHALHLVQTLERKAGLHRQWIGTDKAKCSAGAHISSADAGTILRRLLVKWDSLAEHTPHAEISCQQVLFARIPSDSSAFLAIAEAHGKNVLLSSADSGELPVTTDIHDVLHTAQRVDAWLSRSTDKHEINNRAAECVTADHGTIIHALRQIDAWIIVQNTNEMAGPSVRELSPVQQRAMRELARRVESLSATSRTMYRDRIAEAERHLRGATGAGLEAAVFRWLDQRDLPVGEWLDSVPVTVALQTGNRAESAQRTVDPRLASHTTYRIRALLVLQPQSHSATAAD